MVEHETGEVSVESLVPRNELVAEGQARHEAALLEPENSSKTSGKEDSFDGRVRNDAFCVRRAIGRDPVEGPVSLPAHGRHCVDGVEEMFPLGRVLDVRVDQQAVHFAVNILDGNLFKKYNNNTFNKLL